ncbi:transposable element Tcb1 transposase [Trichonephila clavipes]|nr:transposable element Tcb1 transposase [Trichonephila clavipes]
MSLIEGKTPYRVTLLLSALVRFQRLSYEEGIDKKKFQRVIFNTLHDLKGFCSAKKSGHNSARNDDTGVALHHIFRRSPNSACSIILDVSEENGRNRLALDIILLALHYSHIRVSAFAHMGLDPCLTSTEPSFLTHHELTRSTDERDDLELEDEDLEDDEDELGDEEDSALEAPTSSPATGQTMSGRRADDSSDSDEVTSSQQPMCGSSVINNSTNNGGGICNNNTPTSSTSGDAANPPLKKRKRRVLFSKAQTYELERRYLEFVFLYPSNQEARLKWCWEHGNWTVSDWGNVIFTNESRFALEPDNKRIRIWRKQGTHNQPQNITEHHTFRGGSIMVWTGISLGYRTDLHIFKRGSGTAVRYRDEVLEPIVRLHSTAVGPTFVLMDDNARPHRADIIDDYMESEGLRV